MAKKKNELLITEVADYETFASVHETNEDPFAGDASEGLMIIGDDPLRKKRDDEKKTKEKARG